MEGDNFDDIDAEIKKLMKAKANSDVIVPTKSLFDWKMERRFKGEDERKGLLHRVVIISKMYHNNFTEIGQYYEKLFKDVPGTLQCEGVTGLLLLYPKHCVHVIETGIEMILTIVRDLRQQEKDGSGHLEKSKILIVSHDIPHRLYQHYSFRILDIEAPQLDDYESSEGCERVVIDMLTQLLKLGAYLARQPKVSLKNAMDSLHDKVPELLPQQDVMGYLVENDEDQQCIHTPQQYLHKYEFPYDNVPVSELTWPMPIRLFPYN